MSAESGAQPVEGTDSTTAISAAVAHQIEVIVETAEHAASDLVRDVEGVATRRATDILIDAEKRADRMLDEATRLSTDYLTASRRQIDDFAAERIRRLSELADGLIEVTETIQARHSQVEELNHRLNELITAVGSAAEAVAREAAQSHPSLPAQPKRKREFSARKGKHKGHPKGDQADGEPKSR
jgi:cell division septum initiation protein DivIVA